MIDQLPSKERDTPRTANEWKFHVSGEYGLFVRQVFAQQLERELAEAREDLNRTESARVAILAENEHYKQRVAELERQLNKATIEHAWAIGKLREVGQMYCCDINNAHPGKHRGGCPAQPPGDEGR